MRTVCQLRSLQIPTAVTLSATAASTRLSTVASQGPLPSREKTPKASLSISATWDMAPRPSPLPKAAPATSHSP
jgi:hypothetical protein